MPGPLLVVDGDNLAHRAYHSTPKSVVGVDGQPINAIVGFVSMLVRVWEMERAGGVFVAWDTLGVETYRNRLWPTYQGGRVFEPSIVRQLGILPTVCEGFGLGVGKSEGYEADDLIASVVAKTEVPCLVYTTDKDAYQLVSDRVTVLSPQRGTRELDRVTPARVVERFGVLPSQVPDFKALAGDPSDGIPGARGIGPKSAAALLLKQGTLEAVLEGWPQETAQQILMFRELTTMQTDAPATLPTGSPDWSGGAAVLRTLGAERLAERVLALAGEP